MSNYSLWISDLYRVFLILMSKTERTLLPRLWWMTATLAGCVGMNTAARHPVTGKHWHKGSSSSAGEVRLSVQIACKEAKLSDLNSNRSKRHISVQPWIKKITENSKKNTTISHAVHTVVVQYVWLCLLMKNLSPLSQRAVTYKDIPEQETQKKKKNRLVKEHKKYLWT